MITPPLFESSRVRPSLLPADLRSPANDASSWVNNHRSAARAS